MFFDGEFRSFVRILNGSENFGFSLLCHAYNYDSMSLFATHRVKKNQIILFVKIVNRYFERKEWFLSRQFRSFVRSSVRIKGVTLYLPVVHSKHTASYAG